MLTLKKNIIFIFLAAAFVGLGFSYGKIYAFHLAFILALVFFPFKVAKIFFYNKPSFEFLFPFLILLYYLISIIWATHFVYAIKYVTYLFFGVSIIYFTFFYIKNIFQLNRLIAIFAVLLCLEMVVSLLECYTDFRYPISPYSKLVGYFNRSYKIDPNLSTTVKHALLSMPTGFRWNPNNLATLLGVAFPFLLLLKNKWISVIGTSLLLIVLLATNSRAVIFSSILLFVYVILFEFRLSKKLLLIFVLLCGVFICVPNKFNPISPITQRVSGSIDAVVSIISDDKVSTNSIGSRQELIKNALDEMDRNMWLGVGAGNSKNIQLLKGKVGGGITSLHNFWLEILVEAGVVFFLVFIFWYFYVIYKLILISDKSNGKLSYYAKSTYIAMLFLLLGAISCSSIVYFFPFWILLSIALLVIKLYSNEQLLAS